MTRVPRRSTPWAALAAALLGSLPPAPARASNTNPLLQGGPRHPLPVRPPGAAAAAPPAGAHLTYFGGPVVSSVQVVLVRWGAGTYLPFVTQATAPSLQSFYAGVTSSPYLDWLGEYDTTVTAAGGGPGTGQAIGRGTFLESVQIVPSPANAGTTIDDLAIQAELAAQLASGALPAPTTDAGGFVDTVYMVHFPRGVTITQGGTASCAPRGFCAYHGTFAQGSTAVSYAVLPDMSAGSGCDVGCGNGAAFDNQTMVASHELVEAITDPQVALATASAPPLAWYDDTNGEIGDICNGSTGQVVGGDGLTYVVQQQWSNAAGTCVTTRPTTGDFSIALTPATRSLARATSTTFSISTTLRSGTVPSIGLAVTGLPAGVTAAPSPSSVPAGGSSVLTVSAASLAALGSSSLTVTGTASGLVRTASAGVTVLPAVTIEPAAPQVAPRQALQLSAGGGSGSGFTWSLTAAPSGGTIDPVTGAYRAGATSGVSDLVQLADSLGNTAAAVAVTAQAPPAQVRRSGGGGCQSGGQPGPAGLLWLLAVTLLAPRSSPARRGVRAASRPEASYWR